MGMKLFLSLIFIIIVMSLLILYWFVPITESEFFIQNQGSDFSIGKTAQAKQFYENMRFPDKKISYRIDEECTLQKKDDIIRAFQALEEDTILDFYAVNQNEEITIYCDSTTKIEEGLFIAGEGGPTNITKAGEFNIITKGKILLFRESKCPRPNIAIHELLHVLGFDHVDDPNDIMYEISKCGQEISPITIDVINLIYSIPSYSDLIFENITANMQGKYLNVNMSIRNNGFKDAGQAKIIIYANDIAVKEVNLDPLKIGHGRIISLTNVWIGQLSVKNIRLEITASYDELKKENNEVLLKVKK